MSTLRISLFGKFDVRCDGQILDCLDACKVQELFCYLLLYRHCPHRREIVAGLLWPTSTTAQSMKYLRHTLWRLQTALDSSGATRNGSILLVDSEWIHLNPESDLWLDVAELERACALVQGTPGQELNEHEVQIVKQALELYRGELLEGWYQDWCLFERARLQDMYLAMLEKQMAHCEAHGEYEAGTDYGIRALRCDVAHERVHRRLIRLHYLAGNRTTALRQYGRCVAFLRQELDVAPSSRTVALYEQIRSDRLPDTGKALPTSDGIAPRRASSILPRALDHLKQLQAAFAQVQHQLQETIQMLEVTQKDTN